MTSFPYSREEKAPGVDEASPHTKESEQGRARSRHSEQPVAGGGAYSTRPRLRRGQFNSECPLLSGCVL